MKHKGNILEYSMGVLIFLLIAVLIFVGWRAGTGQGGEAGAGLDVAPVTSHNETAPSDDQSPPATPFSIPAANVGGAFIGSIPVINDNSLVPAAIPKTYQGEKPFHQLQTYIVKRGDTPGGIAESFGLRPETLLGGNPALSQESNLLQTDVELIILPVDGVLYDVQPGDTLESIALQYGIPVEEMIAYEPNNLEFPYRLYPETRIMVPGAVREVFVWEAPDLSSVLGLTSWEGAGVAPIIVGTGTFIYPVGSQSFTQYYWYGHQAVDIALPVGSAVVASDTGTVTYAGWNIYGYGNLIVVNHGNGYETFYAHLNGFNVRPGQIVYQGNTIATSGNTGRSSGPHIHFEIRTYGNRDNPCFFIGC